MRATAPLFCALLLAANLLGGCTSAAFVAANAPSAFGPYERTAGIAYGADPRKSLDVYVPDVLSVDPAPVVVFIHGGAWQTGSKDQYRFVGSGLAEKGYIAVVANYRLNPDVRFPVFVADAAEAVAWTLRNIGQFGGDPGRVFVMGHSAGAHTAMLLALDRRYLAAAGASPDDIRGAIGLSGPYDFAIDSNPLRAVFGSASDPAETQPVTFVRGDAPPLLLIHGTDDGICWVTHSIRLTGLIRTAGGQAELRLYPGLGHGATVGGFSTLRRKQAPTLEDVAAFIAANQGAVPPTAP